MGVAVSDWTLAKAVAQQGQLGVVSGTALDIVLARRLELGDLDGSSRRALAAFPIPGVADRILDKYYIEGGKTETERFTQKPMVSHRPSQTLNELLVASNFVEVWLAKEGHTGVIGINYLEKLQPPTLASIYGSMLAEVDYVLMGAGIPRAIPGILDKFSIGEPAEMRLDVKGAERDDDFVMSFDPAAIAKGRIVELKRPKFLAIITSDVLAKMLATKASGYVDGFIVEMPSAGGHNAPPRGKMQLTEVGEPIYGERDVPNFEKIAAIGRPFWLAGGFATADGLRDAQAVGAVGVQIGTAFAYCEESGFPSELKMRVLAMSRAGDAHVKTDALASPTGFPFKVLQLEQTLSDEAAYLKRKRVCDLGYLRTAYKRENGKIGWRCPSEPIDEFLEKGGTIEETVGRKCVCNALCATIGLAQIQADGSVEGDLVTSGDDVATIARFLPEGAATYSAAHVIATILGEEASDAGATHSARSIV
ncbi:Enoyl-[acyl-carrier-protein] reductase [FMN] [hydrothermal vent metagenome]|uniref:Enoyl-[acyl-carrier-protein] reductase [FMN] n=1 Tax=hydrothermal vent metagenome TaxID=652676 RepID=A0A3B0SRR7_9ZZZZ